MKIPNEIEGMDRVTSVLYPFSGMHTIDPEIVRKAAHRGSIVHQVCDCIISDLPMDDYDPSYEGYINSFKLWKDGKTFLKKPGRFFDDELMITGECDGLYEENGEITLFDLKTPTREGSTWGMQGAAYAHLAKKVGYKIARLEFVRLRKDGKVAVVYHYPLMMQDFLICLQVYRKYFKNIITENFDY